MVEIELPQLIVHSVSQRFADVGPGELACEQATTLDFSVAEANVKLQQFYLENQLPEKLMELDDDFHREFYRLTNRLQTYHLQESMALHFDRVRSLSLATVKDIKIVADHEAILRAVRAGEKEEAAALVTEGKLEEAQAKLVEASHANPQDQAIQLDAVDVLMQLGRNDEAKQVLAGDYASEPERANALRARLALADGAADTATIEARLAADPADHAARLELSRAYAAQSRFREALEAALEVVVRDRFFDEGAGRKAMLQLFEALGGSEQYDDLIREFRRKLSAALN